MDDLISRLAVLKLPRIITRNFFGDIAGESIDVDRIKALPSAELEIIKCRNCKYYKTGSDGLRYCFNHDDDILWQDDDFCSRAERRTDG